MFVVSIFVVLVAATLVTRTHLLSRLNLVPDDPVPHIDPDFKAGTANHDTLFVYVHGMDGGKYWEAMRAELASHGDTVKLGYPRPRLSNVDPARLASRIASEIQTQYSHKGYKRVVLIGQSIGALLVKRAFLEGETTRMDWAGKVERVVLLAGMNRGWDISGQKPSDMRFRTWFQVWFGSWIGRMFGIGNLILKTETGSPFVADVRIDWLNRMREAGKREIEVVQLLGDIDDLVSAEDNKDLRSINSGPFVWIKVRGTRHHNIVDFADKHKAGDLVLGEYRREKFVLAATELDFDKVARENEVQPFQPDLDVTHVVFVVHGIRDLGEWAAAFEDELQTQFRADPARAASDKLAIASIRYGYFGMGPFLLKPVREKYVKWFMDEYTETLARYPKASEVHFVGHSNGTYLLAAALERYESLHVGHVVFAGSVISKNYEWNELLKKRPDLRVRNYAAVDDWVDPLRRSFYTLATVN